MKKIFVLIIASASGILSYSQNVGIGISSPSYLLHVGNGTTRIEGPSAPNTVNAVSIGGFGAVEVDAPGFVGGRFIIKENGNVGIGISSPSYPLSFGSILGDKISLWGGGGPHYGFGVQSGLFQIHSDAAGADIAFGFGSSTAFSEMVRIKGNGVLQFSPLSAKKLIMNAGAAGDAGMFVSGTELRIASEGNNGDIVFGYDNRASGFGERFRIKGNGALAVNGVTGSAGQLLIAGAGPGGTTGWDYGLTKAFTSGSSSFTPLNNNGDETSITSVTVTVQKTSVIHITGTVWLNTSFCLGCGDATVYLLMNDPTASGPEFIVAANPHVINLTTMNFTYSPRFTVSPGTYTFTLRARKVSGSPVTSALLNGDPNYKSDLCRLTALVTPI